MARRLRSEFGTHLVVTCAALLVITLLSFTASALGPDDIGLDSNGRLGPARAGVQDADASAPGYSVGIAKAAMGIAGASVNEKLAFEIALTNTGSEPLSTLSLSDTYATDCLEFLSSEPPADDHADGQLAWANLLSPGEQL